MITVSKRSKSKLVSGTLNDLKTLNPTWCDCASPSDKELDDVCYRLGTNPAEIKSSLAERERPRLIDYRDYTLIVFNAVYKKDNTFGIAPVVIYLSRRTVVTFRRHKFVSFEKFDKLTIEQRSKLMERGHPYFVFRLLDEIIANFFTVFDTIEDDIDKVEAHIFRKAEQKSLKQIFNIKKQLIHFHKSLVADREVVAELEKGYSKQIGNKEQTNFRVLYSDITELIDVEGTYRETLTGVLETYLSQSSNDLNKVMKKLTALASFILIPTLITGVYGMNFKYLPEVQWQYGYYFSLGLMVLSIVLLYLYFKKKDYL